MFRSDCRCCGPVMQRRRFPGSTQGHRMMHALGGLSRSGVCVQQVLNKLSCTPRLDKLGFWVAKTSDA